MYDTDTGRFLSKDPLLNEESSVSINPYIYVDNNPLIKIDPNGKLPFLVVAAYGLYKAYNAYQSYKEFNQANTVAGKLTVVAWAGTKLIPGGEIIGGAKHLATGFKWIEKGRRNAKFAQHERELAQIGVHNKQKYSRLIHETIRNGKTVDYVQHGKRSIMEYLGG